MGQYGNQPDFGTRANAVGPQGTPNGSVYNDLKSAALYIGTGGTLVCEVVGGNTNNIANFTIFNNIPDGTFFPVIVKQVYQDSGTGVPTDCADIVALY